MTSADPFQDKVSLSTSSRDGLTTFQRHCVQFLGLSSWVFSVHCCGGGSEGHDEVWMAAGQHCEC